MVLNSSKNSSRSPLASILFWSVISAAFIGPGTVTTASRAGAAFGTELLWALSFSTIACILLQEVAARIPLASGLNLGQAIAQKFGSGPYRWLLPAVGISIIFGGAAYQAGNILGAVAGTSLLFDWSPQITTLIIGITCGGILWIGNPQIIARILGVIVAVMGLVFIIVAIRTGPSPGETLMDAFIPRLPGGSGWLIIGLIGTTIVPYNLFLGSGLSHGQDIRTMRTGLITAIAIGGIISIAIMLVGTNVSGEFSFPALAATLESSIGPWAKVLFGGGLFAAGFTSAITAPLASSMAAASLFEKGQNTWLPQSRNFRLVWGGVLLTGIIFGVSGIRPVPAIILAQALNGLLLPFISIFLFLLINDHNLIPEHYRNTLTGNLLLLLVTGITLTLGFINLMKAGYQVFDVVFPDSYGPLIVAGGCALLIILVLWRKV